MKTLILFRHGKSDWGAGASSDRDRPLAKRGLKAARTMGKYLQMARQLPDVVVSSPALRATSTAEAAIEAGGWTCPLRTSEALYDAHPGDVLLEMRKEPETTQRLLLVGHQPTWSELAAFLAGGADIAMPTACMLRIDFECESWAEVGAGTGRLVWLVPPRLLTDGEIEL